MSKKSIKKALFSRWTSVIAGCSILAVANQAEAQANGRRAEWRAFKQENPGARSKDLRALFQQSQGANVGSNSNSLSARTSVTNAIVNERVNNCFSTADHVRNASMQQIGTGRSVRLNNGIDLDLSSSLKGITLGEKLFRNVESIEINTGGETRTLSAGSVVTPAEYVAAKQVLNGSGQKLTLSNDGTAIGGSLDLSAVADGNGTMRAAGLLVPTNVTAQGNFAKQSTFDLQGDLDNSGTVLTYSDSRGRRSGTIHADDIVNQEGGVITSLSDVGHDEVDLTLVADGTLTNLGTISSSGNLTIEAGDAITNAAGRTISGNGNVSLATIQVDNRGRIESRSGDLTISSADQLEVNNMSGVLAADNAINIRDAHYNGEFDTHISGGDFLSNTLNLNAGLGTIEANIGNATGQVNSNGYAVHLNANSDILTIGDTDLVDPTYRNHGEIRIGGDIKVAANLTIISTDFIIQNPGTNITIETGTGDLTMIAGANILEDKVGDIGFLGPIPPEPAGAVTTVSGGSAQGGSINFSDVTINTNSGDVLLAAFSGTTQSSGSITVVTGDIKATTTGGDFTAIAPNGVTTETSNSTGAGFIDTTGGPAGLPGNVLVITSQPTTSDLGPITYAADGSIASKNTIVPGTFADNSPSNSNAFSMSKIIAKGTVNLKAGQGGFTRDISSGGTVTIQAGNGLGTGAITADQTILIETGLNPAATFTEYQTKGAIKTSLGDIIVNVDVDGIKGDFVGSNDIIVQGPGDIKITTGGDFRGGDATRSITAAAGGDVIIQANDQFNNRKGWTIQGANVSLTGENFASLATGSSVKATNAISVSADSFDARGSLESVGGDITVVSTGSTSPDDDSQIAGILKASIGTITIDSAAGLSSELSLTATAKNIVFTANKGDMTFNSFDTAIFNGFTTLNAVANSIIVDKGTAVTVNGDAVLNTCTFVQNGTFTVNGTKTQNCGTANSGTLINTIGDVVLNGDIVFNASNFAIIAAGDIKSGTATKIVLSGPDDGGTLFAFAGVNASPATKGQTFNTSTTFTINGPSLSGGDIELSGVDIDTSGTKDDGGNALLFAFSGATNTGSINVGDIISKGADFGGDVTVIGPGDITVGSVDTTGAGSSGDATIMSATPVINGGSFTVLNGQATANITAGALSKGVVLYQNVNAGSGNAIIAGNLTGLAAASTVTANSVDLRSLGDIGSGTNNPLLINTPIVTIDADGNAFVSNTSTEASLLDTTTIGADLDYFTKGSLTVVDDVTTVDGDISIEILTGQLRIDNDVEVTANSPTNNGNVFIGVATDGGDKKLDTIVFGPGSSVQGLAATKPGGNVTLQLGAVPVAKPGKPSPIQPITKAPKGVALDPVNGGIIQGTKKPLMGDPAEKPPTNTLRADAATLTVINELKSKNFLLQGGVLVNADPPSAPAVLQTNDSSSSPAFAPTLASANKTMSLDGAATLTNVQSAKPALMQLITVGDAASAGFAEIASQLVTAQQSSMSSRVDFGSSASSLITNAVNTEYDDDSDFSAPLAQAPVAAHICSDQELKFVSGDGAIAPARLAHSELITMDSGCALFVPKKDMMVVTPHGKIKIKGNSVALVSTDEKQLSVYDLDDHVKRGVMVLTNGHEFVLSPGRHFIVADSSAREFGTVNPIQSIMHRSVSRHKLGAHCSAFTSEFSIPSAVNSVSTLKSLTGAKHGAAKNIVDRMIKTSAIVMQLDANGLPFEFHAAPCSVALGNR